MRKIKATQEIDRQHLEIMIYSAFFMGFMARNEYRTVGHKDNFTEIRRFIDIMFGKILLPLSKSSNL